MEELTMAIYSRDNLQGSLATALENSLRRIRASVDRDAERRKDNAKAVNSLLESMAYASEASQDDTLEDKLKALETEREKALEAKYADNLEAVEHRLEGTKNGEVQYSTDSLRQAIGGPYIAELQSRVAMDGYTPNYVPEVTTPNYAEAIARRQKPYYRGVY